MISADENVWLPVVEGRRRRGRDVTTALEEGTVGRPDRRRLAYALENDWILLTVDDDCRWLVESEGGLDGHPGIVYASQHGISVSQHGKDVGELVRRIDDELRRNRDSDLAGRVRFA